MKAFLNFSENYATKVPLFTDYKYKTPNNHFDLFHSSFGGQSFLLAVYLAALETDAQAAKFEYIYKRYFNFMWKTAFSITHDSNYAEDAVHEVFLQIIKEIDSLRLENETELKSYLFLITRERTIDFLRKWDRKKNIQNDINYTVLDESTDSPEHLVFTRIQLEKVLDALSDLPEDYKRPLLLQVKGYSISEISQIMQCNSSTVKSRIHRARKKILNLFSDNQNS